MDSTVKQTDVARISMYRRLVLRIFIDEIL